jgi:hypothetical protein
VAVLWSLLRGRGHPRLALAAGVAFVLLAVGFWALGLGRPYGLFLDARITRCAGDASVTAAGAAPPGEGMVVDEPAACGAGAALGRVLRPRSIVLAAPSVVPVLVLPILGILAYALWAAQERGLPGVVLWLAFSTGELEKLRGVGFLPGLWAHPGSAVLLVALVAAPLVLCRLSVRASTATALGAAALAPWLLVRAPFEGRSLVDTALVLTLDQTPWWLLAAWGWRRGTAPAARALVLGGAGLLVAGAFPLGIDAWGAQAFYRLGLLLSAAGPVVELAERLGAAMTRAWRRGPPAPDLGAAVLVLAGAPACFLAWWLPSRIDPLMEASRAPVADRLAVAMAWVRETTPPRSVFLTSADYAPTVAVLGGRRVLRAPTLGPSADEVRRDRMEDKLLSGRDSVRLADLYGLTHVFIAPGDFAVYGIATPADLRRGRFRLVYADAVDYRATRSCPRRPEERAGC